MEQQKLKLDCLDHQNQRKKFIRVDKDAEDSLYCSYCLHGSKNCQFMSVKKLIEIQSNENKFLTNWPPLIQDEQEAILTKIKIFFEDDSQDQNKQEEEVKKCFEQAKNKINSLIHQLEKLMQQKINSLGKEKVEIKEKYIEMTRFLDMLEIIRNEQLSIQQKDEGISQIVKNCYENAETNTEFLSSRLKNLEDNVNRNNLINQVENFHKQIEVITKNFQSMIDKDNFEIYNNNNIDMNSDQKVKLLFDFISNKSNNLNQEFLLNINEKLQDLKILFDDVEFNNIYSNENLIQFNFQDLNDQKKEQISQIFNLIQKEEVDRNQQNQDKAEKLISLIANKSNFCTDTFLQQIKMNLNKYYFIFSDLDIDNLHNENFHPIDFSVLNQQQMIDLQKLVQKISEITSKNNFEIVQQTQQAIIQNIQKSAQFQENISQLFASYPILQLTNYTTKNVGFDLVKSEYDRSPFLKIENQRASIQYEEGNHHQAYTNFILQKDKNYIFRVLYKSQNSYMGFGLTSDNCRDQNLFSQNLAFRNKGGNYGLQKNFRGSNLTDAIHGDKFSFYEIRINLSKKYYQIADYPNYQNINSIFDSFKILENESYRFVINIHGQHKIGDFIEIAEILQVEEFPSW